MPRRNGFALIEVVVATVLFVTVVLVVTQSATALRAVAAGATRWRRAAGEVEVLLGRFAQAPCPRIAIAPFELDVGGITFRWAFTADSGQLLAVRWPDDAPLVARRGALRSTLPCD